MTWLFGHSTYLARILCNRPELDSFVFRAQQKYSEDLGTLLEELTEKRLLTELIGGSDFLEGIKKSKQPSSQPHSHGRYLNENSPRSLEARISFIHKDLSPWQMGRL